MERPSGIIPALSTMTDADLQLDDYSQRSLVRANIKWGCSGLAVSIVAGEFYKFTDQERVKTFRTVVEEVSNTVPVWGGVGHLGTEPVVNLARQAKDIGVDGIIAQAGLVGKDAQAGVYEHFNSIMSRTDLPIMIQDAEDFNGIHIDPEIYVKLAKEHSNFVSVKIEGGETIYKIKHVRTLLEGRVTILGGMGGRLLLEELQSGTDGSIPNSCLTDLVVDVFQKKKSGREIEALDSFNRYRPWLQFQSEHSASSSEIVKETLRLRKITSFSTTRSPHVSLTETARSELKKLLEKMKIIVSE